MTAIQGYADQGAGLRLHLNENTGGCPSRVLDGIACLSPDAIATYPSYAPLVNDVAAHFDVDPGCVLLTNGLDGPPTGREGVAGLTPWDPKATVRSQLRAGGALQGVSESGTLALLAPRDQPMDAEQLAAELRHAWRKTDVVRLRVVRP